MANLCLFGLSGAGKTCFIYAMSQLLGTKGASGNDMVFTMKANTPEQQKMLDNGYMTLLDNQWPQPTNVPTKYDYCLRLQHKRHLMDIIPNLIVDDYRGGILDFGTEKDRVEYNKMIQSFNDSVAIIYVIDGLTLFNALDPDDRDSSHNYRKVQLKDNIYAKQQISIVENLFIDFKRRHKEIPPVLVAISKDDMLTGKELNAGKNIIMSSIPSVFGRGSQTIGAITHFSLGADLESGLQGDKLVLGTESNLHIPVLFGAYVEFCRQYDKFITEGSKRTLMGIMKEMRKIFRGRIDIFNNGEKTIEI